MAAALLNSNRNLSLYCIPAAWVISIIPHFYASQLGKFDNTQPRTYTRSIENDQTLDSATKGKIVRAEGAQQNGFENIGLFAAAVVAGNIAKLDNPTLNMLSIGYLGTRVIYNYLYITNTTAAMANGRSVAFLSGIATIFTLFIKSGNALHDRL